MFNKVISILGTLILLVLAGCRDVAPISVEEPSTENRTITLNLDITTRADNLPPDNSEPDIIRLWIFDDDNKFIKYIVSSQNEWYLVGNDGKDIMTTLQTEIDAKDINSESEFKIYLILNQPYEAYEDSTTPIDFSNIKTISELKLKTFVLTEYDGDNKVPMTGMGTATCTAIEGNKIKFNTSIDATRCVAKLGIYCTKGNTSSTLTIDRITLSKVPDKGYLFEPDPDSYTSIKYTGTKNLLSITEQITVTKYYTGKMPSYSEDSWAETTTEESFEEISSPYLLENLNRNVTDDGFLQVNGSITDDDKRYCITLSYTLNGVGYTQNIYVSQIKRNQYSKIYIRINDAITIDTYCQVNSWTEHIMYVPPFE